MTSWARDYTSQAHIDNCSARELIDDERCEVQPAVLYSCRMLYVFILVAYGSAFVLGMAVAVGLWAGRRLPRVRGMILCGTLVSLPGFVLANALFIAIWMALLMAAKGVNNALPPQPVGMALFEAFAGSVVFMIGALIASFVGAVGAFMAGAYCYARRRRRTDAAQRAASVQT